MYFSLTLNLRPPHLWGGGTAACGGGGGRQSSYPFQGQIKNSQSYVIRMGQQIPGYDPVYVNALIHKPKIAGFIVLALIIMRMDFAIDFNAKLSFGAIKIENVRT